MHALGDAELAGYEARLHAWADGYRDKGWPEETPDYLLTGYTRLAQHGADPKRPAALVLDPRRQLRLVDRSGMDLALSDLDLAAAAATDDTPRSLSLRAGAAVSRELLLRHSGTLPPSMSRALARLGDARRARSLALASPFASAKAAALADVARVLAGTGHERAPETAREAATWARAAGRQTRSPGGDLDGTESAAAARAAVALIATRQVEAGVELLRATRGVGTEQYEARAEAVRLLRPDHPAPATELLDGMEEQAEDLADLADGHGHGTGYCTRFDYGSRLGEDRAAPVQFWAILAAAAPERADRIHDGILGHARAVWAGAPTLENIDVLALAASALAVARPEEAAALARTGGQYLRSMVGRAGSGSTADLPYAYLSFGRTFERLMRALADTGVPTDQRQRLYDVLPEHFRACLTSSDATPFGGDAATAGGTGSGDEAVGRAGFEDSGSSGWWVAEKLARDAFRLAELGRVHEAKHRLDEALTVLRGASGPEASSPPAISWLPALAGALVRVGRHADADELAAGLTPPAEGALALAAVSLAYGDSGRGTDARRHAHEAARAARAALGTADDYATAYRASRAWASAAQALAWAGEGDAAVELFEEAEPWRRGRKGMGRSEAREARTAVATGVAAHDPALAAGLVDEERERLLASWRPPRGSAGSRLADLAELLPAAAAAAAVSVSEEPCLERLHDAIRGALAYTTEPPQTWREETVLVHALLRIGSGTDPAPQLDWLDRTMRARHPERFPAAGLAVVHALRGDTSEAWRTADRLRAPEHRSAAFAAVAGHLARAPARVPPSQYPADPDRFTHVVRALALALAASPHTPADKEAASRFARQSLEGADTDWHHALAVLAALAPEAVVRVRDIAFAHLRTGTPV
ncbi:hypothetical protein [Streptomyces sp. ICC1]|uniref:hypothetical protein n=1 Tax=Streptomyces sp. ICC1 TaxID=2099583 RepID=UPI000DC79FA1|nr:hypothetical protein [Streptomyces sp. ICC1]AWZ16023.1 hypothetical protein DRB96_31470 [Streptomyces sp. ICC1]